MTDKPITLAFALLADYNHRNDAAPLCKFEGCWEKQVDEHWWIAMNGHEEPVRCSRGPKVPPYNCYVEFNGFPAGILDPFGGEMIAHYAANEDKFIDALRAAGAVVKDSDERLGQGELI